MIYNEEKGRLEVSVSEAVTIARRGISPTPSRDEDEPIRIDLESIGYADLGGNDLSYDFTREGLDFTISGKALFIERDDVHLLFPIPTMRDKKRAEVKAEARGEGYLLAAIRLLSGHDAKEMRIRTVYYSVSDRTSEEEVESATRDKILAFFDKITAELPVSGRVEIERVTKRLPSMKAARFPYGKPRLGQSEFIKSAYRTIAKGGELFATAPTGTGKTVSAIFPAVRAIGAGFCDKAFYFTPKTTTADAAVECIKNLSEGGALIRSIVLVAKDRICQNGKVCKLSKKLCRANKENHLKEALIALADLDLPTVTPKEVQKIAAEHTVCPYELSLTYAELCDIVICDFNYLFDPDVYIRRFFSARGNYAFLIDEAHNLPERAREMYSAELDIAELENAASVLGEHSDLANASAEAASALRAILFPLVKDELREDKDGIKYGSYNSHDMPSEFYALFDGLSVIAEEELFKNFGAKDEERDERIAFIREYSFKLKKLARAVNSFDNHFELFVHARGDEIKMKIFCLDTGKVIRDRLDLGRASIIFSGTLTPLSYYSSVLGGDRASKTLTVDSPFAREQVCVSVMHKITTRFSEREKSLGAICKTIACTMAPRKGNYMIFTPSFAYCEALSEAFKKRYGKIKVITQTADMSPREKAEFLDEFSGNKYPYLAAFCVMGGIYSEGIDLVGDKLIGAVIVGIGMPTLSYEREAIKAYYDDKTEAGTQFAYLYPGMNRVMQAAGRVIRTEDDYGVIVLIDDRFDDPLYKKTVPNLWRGMQFLDHPDELRARIEDFWQEVDEAKMRESEYEE